MTVLREYYASAAKLMQEANEDAEHEGFCDQEMGKNTATIEEAKQAAAATQKAMTVLREYYASAAEAAALAQFRAGTFGKEPYTGMGGTAGGVVAMLEVIESDFKRLDAETTADEMQAASDYNAFMTDASKSKAVKTADMTNKAKMKTGAEADLLAAKKDLKSTKEELDAALAYFEKLKPSCVEAGESYAQRVAKRKE